MRKSWLVLIAAAFIITACESTPDADATASTDGGVGSQAAVVPAPDVGANSIAPLGTNQLTQDVADRVFFDTDSSEISAASQAVLAKQAEWLKSRTNLKITIEGHCDERGTREYNLALGERRANATKGYLVAQGVPADRITTISYGKEKPAVPGNDEAAWTQNRRAVTVVQ